MPNALSTAADPGTASWAGDVVAGVIVAMGTLNMTANPTTAAVPGVQDGDLVIPSVFQDTNSVGAVVAAQITGGLLSIEMSGPAGAGDILTYVVIRPDA